jgi:hypothetical protein
MHSFISPAVFNPKSIPNLYGWYKFDSLILSGVSPTQTVSAALDKSGGNRHAIQPISGQQPNYTSAGGANGFPYWSNTDAVSGGKYLLAGTTSDWTFLHDGSGFTVFIVFKTASTQQNYLFGTQTGAGLSQGLSIARLNNTSARLGIGTGFSQNISVDYSQTLTSWSKLAFSGSTGSDPDYSIRVAGASVATANEINPVSSATSIQKLGIGSGGGGAYSLASNLHEVIIYNRELSLQEVQKIEQYLKAQYKL